MKTQDYAGGGVVINVSVNTTVSPPGYLYCGTSGDINVTMADDGTVLLIPSLGAGWVHPIKVKAIWASGTTASGVRIFYKDRDNKRGTTP